MILPQLHWLVILIYPLLPLAAVARAIYWFRRRRRRPMRRLILAFIGGSLIAAAVCVMSAAVVDGRVGPRQAVAAAYFATALLLLLQLFDQFLWTCFHRVFQLTKTTGPRWWFSTRVATAILLRAVVLFGIGLPYILAATLTFRPHVTFPGDPQTQFHRPFDRVEFPSTDGVHLVGWWIPSTAGESQKTVLLCHGLAGGKLTPLNLAGRLMDGGYNILTFDFRDHGESGGVFTSFGALEARDVLGAVRWLRQTHPSACHRLAGLGINTGAAALISAAADPSPEGQNIDLIAVYGTFDRFDSEVKDIADQFMPAPLGWLAQRVGLPLAGAQVGTDLQHFSPAQDVKKLWPRPILVIHGLEDELVPFERGENLYDAALQPKLQFWIERANQTQTLQSIPAQRVVKRFFDSARELL